MLLFRLWLSRLSVIVIILELINCTTKGGLEEHTNTYLITLGGVAAAITMVSHVPHVYSAAHEQVKTTHVCHSQGSRLYVIL